MPALPSPTWSPRLPQHLVPKPWFRLLLATALLHLSGPLHAQTTHPATAPATTNVSTLGAGETKPFFSLVALPDPQHYNDQHPEVFHQQIEWIAAHAHDQHIVFATCEGDIVEHYGAKTAEWDAADKSLSQLDGVIPWGTCLGNHDVDTKNDPTRAAKNFLQHFGPKRFAQQPWFGGASDNGLSSFQLLEAAGLKLLILHLEIAAPDDAVAWAKKVLDDHPDRPTIVVTHIYLNDKTKARDTDSPSYLGKQSHSAEWLFQNLIRKQPQIFLVLSGHFDNAGGQFHQTSLNDQGAPVHEVLADYQNHKNGGNGYLRILRFIPERKTIEIRTYSPTLDTFMIDQASEFVLPWESKLAAQPATAR